MDSFADELEHAHIPLIVEPVKELNDEVVWQGQKAWLIKPVC